LPVENEIENSYGAPEGPEAAKKEHTLSSTNGGQFNNILRKSGC